MITGVIRCKRLDLENNNSLTLFRRRYNLIRDEKYSTKELIRTLDPAFVKKPNLVSWKIIRKQATPFLSEVWSYGFRVEVKILQWLLIRLWSAIIQVSLICAQIIFRATLVSKTSRQCKTSPLKASLHSLLLITNTKSRPFLVAWTHKRAV